MLQDGFSKALVLANTEHPPPTTRTHKVAAFILRDRPDGTRQLLLHAFADAPTLPLRLPGGGVETGERPLAALWREVAEETGLRALTYGRKLGVRRYFKPYTGRHIARHDYLLWAPADGPAHWTWRVGGQGAGAGDSFLLRWVAAADLPALALDDEHARYLTPRYLPELFAAGSTRR